MQRALEALASRMPAEPIPSLRLLSNFTATLAEQFGAYFRTGRLRIAAPYFGGSTGGLKLLREELQPTCIQVFPAVHAGSELDVSVEELRALPDVTIHALKMAKRNSFSHLKDYGFESSKGEWMFTTSANCTLAALGGDNVEAGLLRRVDQETLEKYFAEQPHAVLPTATRAGDYAGSGRWFHLWATDRGARLELIAGAPEGLPLRHVTTTIRCGTDLVSKLHQSFMTQCHAVLRHQRFGQPWDVPHRRQLTGSLCQRPRDVMPTKIHLSICRKNTPPSGPTTILPSLNGNLAKRRMHRQRAETSILHPVCNTAGAGIWSHSP